MSARLADRDDTIAAIATAPGRGGIGIIRLSGPDAERIGRVARPELGVHRSTGDQQRIRPALDQGVEREGVATRAVVRRRVPPRQLDRVASQRWLHAQHAPQEGRCDRAKAVEEDSGLLIQHLGRRDREGVR